MLTEKFERLVAANIQLIPLPGIARHFVFERDGFAALVERTPSGFGQIGGAGLVCDKGLAVLIWRDGDGYFVTKGFERKAEPAEIEELRRFSADLERSLS